MAKRRGSKVKHAGASGKAASKRAAKRTGSQRGKALPPAIAGQIWGKEVRSAKRNSNVLGIAGLAMTVLLNLGTVIYTAGVMNTRVGHLEEAMKEQKVRSEGFLALSNKMAGVEAQLVSIGQSLMRLEGEFSRARKGN